MTARIIDAHQHLIMADRLGYSWTRRFDKLDGRSFTLDDYRAAAVGIDIGQTVFLEADADDWRGETDMVLGLAAKTESKIGGIVVNARPEAAKPFAPWLEKVAAMRVSGLRRILHTMPDDLSRTEAFRANLRMLPAYGLTFDLCVLERQLAFALELVKSCPKVQFVIDHCGNPDLVQGDLTAWRRSMKALAACDNTACKISGIMVNCAAGDATLDRLRPVIEFCIESFGWDRVLFGTDWPVCTLNGSLAGWYDIVKAVVEQEDTAFQGQLFAATAARLYRLS